MTSASKRRVNEADFRSYELTLFDDLIPLHRYSDKTERRGRVTLDGKRPRDSNWNTRTYVPEKVIAEAISANRNVGVRLSATQMVFDIDPRNGGADSWPMFCADFGIDPSIFPHVITGSGGSHYYCSKPEDVTVIDTLEDYPGVEFKSSGRQVVGAGSIHPETKELYKWAPDSAAVANGIPPCPKKILNAIARPKNSGETIGGGQYSTEKIAHALEALDPCAFNSNDKWLRLMMSVHHASNGDARQEFIDWSIGDPDYAKDAFWIGRRWDSLHRDKTGGELVTFRTLEAELIKAGAQDRLVAGNASEDFEDYPLESRDLEEDESGKELTLAGQRGLKVNGNGAAYDTFLNALKAVRRSKLDIAWDELKQNAVVRGELPWDPTYGRILNDNLVRLIRVHLMARFQGNAYEPSKEHLFEALRTVAFSAKFNPVLEYLDSLKWDGVKRAELLFPRYFACGDDAYARAVSLCLLIGAIRRMRRPGWKFDTMPILQGPQGWNKSSGVKVLFGEEWFSDANLGSLANKDAALNLRGLWVQELAELESLRVAEVATLKAFMSRGIDRQRDPYEKLAQDVPRRNVFVGTVNENGYLRDSTGARRFWPLEIRKPIDLKALAADRDQIWAEANAMEAAGYSDVLPQELWPLAAKRQSAQTTSDPWVDTIKSFLAERAEVYEHYDPETNMEGDEPAPPPDRVHTSELFEALCIAPRDRTKGSSQRLRVVMENAIGWKHSESVRVLKRTGAGYRPST